LIDQVCLTKEQWRLFTPIVSSLFVWPEPNYPGPFHRCFLCGLRFPIILSIHKKAARETLQSIYVTKALTLLKILGYTKSTWTLADLHVVARYLDLPKT